MNFIAVVKMWWLFDLLQENKKRYQCYLDEVGECSLVTYSDTTSSVTPVRKSKMQDSETELQTAVSSASLKDVFPKPHDAVIQVSTRKECSITNTKCV